MFFFFDTAVFKSKKLRCEKKFNSAKLSLMCARSNSLVSTNAFFQKKNLGILIMFRRI